MKLLLFLAAIQLSSCAYIRVCYVTNWAQYRHGVGSFSIASYEDGLCTHIIYAFASVESGSIVPYESNDISDGYPQVNSLKNKDSNLKTLLAIGGWNHASRGFVDLVRTSEARLTFAKHAVDFLIKYGFDGLDLDWEYPAQRGSLPGDKHLFTLFCEDIKNEFSKHDLLLTAAVAAGVESGSTSYEIFEISKHLDFINLMTYDLHGSWEEATGHHTDSSNSRPMTQHSVYNSVNHWLSSKMDPSKLILGLATYGRTWMLQDACRNSNLGASTTGAGLPGIWTSESGFLAYYEICRREFESRVCTSSSSVNAPYGSDGRDFIGYDDQESIGYKIKNIMKKKNLGGFMVWALDLDDFNNHCGDGKYPLIKAAIAATENDYNTASNCQDVRRTRSCPPPPTLPPSKCRVNPIGPWRNKIKEDSWCRNEKNCPYSKACPHYKGCTDCMCECDDDVTGTEPTSITKSSVSTQSTTGTDPVNPDTCIISTDMGSRTRCYLNPNGLWKDAGTADWCRNVCPKHMSCNINMCCCDSGSTPTNSTSRPTTSTTTVKKSTTTTTKRPTTTTTRPTTTAKKATTTTTTTTTTRPTSTTTRPTTTVKKTASTTTQPTSTTTRPTTTVKKTTSTTTRPTTTAIKTTRSKPTTASQRPTTTTKVTTRATQPSTTKKLMTPSTTRKPIKSRYCMCTPSRYWASKFCKKLERYKACQMNSNSMCNCVNLN